MRTVYSSILRAFGFTTLLHADTVADALDQLSVFAPDLAIIDFQLKGETGLAFVRQLRAHKSEALATVPVIIVTPHTTKKMIRAFINAGVDEVLTKPVQADALFARIKAITTKRRPYVRVKGYTGPDRRRKVSDVEIDRRTEDTPKRA